MRQRADEHGVAPVTWLDATDKDGSHIGIASGSLLLHTSGRQHGELAAAAAAAAADAAAAVNQLHFFLLLAVRMLVSHSRLPLGAQMHINTSEGTCLSAVCARFLSKQVWFASGLNFHSKLY